ncbi:MAG: hydroxymethylglutaryl-CoA lyase [Deltaproteobacteria bacterium]|nr:hydroxymethylglutaryl-CoA lyase [Deltaproteobacteria bacterium]
MNREYPANLLLTEVGPRDGLQNEKGQVPTAQKVAFIEKLVEAGVTRLEAGSFVSPKWVPQMADTAEIFQKLKRKEGVKYIALVPNRKGMEGALANQVTDIAVFTAASETFTKRNINATIEESLINIQEVVQVARQNNMWVRGYLSTCFVCPYEGKIAPSQVLKVAKRLLAMGVDELSIGDTIGAATPNQVTDLVSLLGQEAPLDLLALHFHDTRGTALANVLAGMQAGVRKFDGSAGGLGGCPYAPGASGNLATEDLLYMLEGMGIQTGIDLQKVVEASQIIAQALGRTLPGRYLQAHLAQASRNS